MTEEEQAIKILSKYMQIAIEEKIATAPYDKTVQGRVMEVLTDNFYNVQIDGGVYTIPSLTDMTFSKNETVWVTYMSNNENNKAISGRRKKK